MSTPLERAWSDVIAGISGRPGSIAALVNALDQCEALDRIKERILAEAAAELRGDGLAPVPNGKRRQAECLLDALPADGLRVADVRARAQSARIGWRTVQAVKATAGVVSVKRADGWHWIKAATPQALAESDGTLTPDG
jgi:hypothetical protein